MGLEAGHDGPGQKEKASNRGRPSIVELQVVGREV